MFSKAGDLTLNENKETVKYLYEICHTPSTKYPTLLNNKNRLKVTSFLTVFSQDLSKADQKPQLLSQSYYQTQQTKGTKRHQ